MSSRTAQTYVITGAARGLGFEFVRQLAAANSDNIVVALARNPSTANQVHELIMHNKNIYLVKLDVINETTFKSAAEEVAKLAPNDNAGIAGTFGINTTTITRKNYLEVFETNVFGVSDTTQAFLPLLRKSHTKKIINITSDLGSISRSNQSKSPAPISPAYKASKAALNMITLLTSQDLRNEGFIVVGVHPGWVRTSVAGTENAPLSPKESISVMLNVLYNLKDEDTGKYFSYDGSILPY